MTVVSVLTVLQGGVVGIILGREVQDSKLLLLTKLN